MRLPNGETLLHWPLAQHILTQGWTYNDSSAHNAIDLRAAVGTPVYAAEDGTIDQRQVWDGKTKTGMQSYGNMVRIRHAPHNGGSLHTRYGHLSKMLVAAGQAVKEGDLIGYSGESGNCFGAHLHFEVLYKGARTNPLNWLDGDFSCASATVQAHLGSYHSVVVPVEPPAAPAAQLQHVRVRCADSEDGAQIGRLLSTLQVPLEATVSNGDAYSIMRAAQALGAEYASEYVEE